jgi:adenylate cyclase
MRVGAKSAAVWALPLAAVIGALVLIAVDPGGIATRVRGIQFDAYQYLHKRLYRDPLAKSGYTVRVLDIDDAAIARFGAWPWSHSALAKLVGELKTAGAAIVVVDAPLTKPDALSPQAFAKSLAPGPQNDAVRRALSDMPSPDDALARALSTINSVTAFTLSHKNGGAAPALKDAVVFGESQSVLADIPAFDHATAPLREFQTASAGLGARNTVTDPDGKLRAIPLLFRLNKTLVPTLDAEVMRLAGGSKPITITTRERGIPNINAGDVIARIGAGTLSVPVRPDGAMEIYYAGAAPQRHIRASALDDGTVAPGSLDHAIVYVAPPGAVAATPLGPESIGDVHAEAMENMLLHTPLVPARGPYGGMVFLLVVGIGIALLVARAGLLWAGVLTVAAIVAAQSFTWVLFTGSRTLFDSLNPSLALAACFAAALAARSLEIARTRARLRHAFADALPAPTLDQIARAPARLKIEGETRTVTCLACGVRGYAGLAESFTDDPVGFTRMMESVMTPLVDAAIAHGGMVDCVTGEGFHAYWNAPLDDSEHAIHACEAASRMTVALAEVNEQLSRERRFDGTAYEPVEIGIGLSTGPAIAGGFGVRGRTAYSVSGDCTLLAERIRAQSAAYGPAIVASDDTRKAAERGYAFLEVDFIACGSRGEPVKLFALLGNPLVRASPKFRALATFHEHIFQSLRTQQWEKTRELIDQCRKLSGASQKLYDLHLTRIQYFEEHPPDPDWDGAFRPILK